MVSRLEIDVLIFSKFYPIRMCYYHSRWGGQYVWVTHVIIGREDLRTNRFDRLAEQPGPRRQVSGGAGMEDTVREQEETGGRKGEGLRGSQAPRGQKQEAGGKGPGPRAPLRGLGGARKASSLPSGPGQGREDLEASHYWWNKTFRMVLIHLNCSKVICVHICVCVFSCTVCVNVCVKSSCHLPLTPQKQALYYDSAEVLMHI